MTRLVRQLPKLWPHGDAAEVVDRRVVEDLAKHISIIDQVNLLQFTKPTAWENLPDDARDHYFRSAALALHFNRQTWRAEAYRTAENAAEICAHDQIKTPGDHAHTIVDAWIHVLTGECLTTDQESRLFGSQE